MSMSKLERRIYNKKRANRVIKDGTPKLEDLANNQTQLRNTKDGLVEFTRIGSVLYKKVLDKA